jgi:hypothetical protein
MAQHTPGRLDPALLAEEVRDLANDARRVLYAPVPAAPEIDDLAARVDRLQDQIRGYSFNQLACWLDSVRQIIEAC